MQNVNKKCDTRKAPKPKYGRWFRLYDDTINDPKVQCLDGTLFKAWINCLCIANQCDGIIKRDDVAFRLRLSASDGDQAIETLIAKGLLEYSLINGDQCLTPHSWKERQPNRDKSALRMRKLRARKKARGGSDASRDGSSDGDVPISSISSVLPRTKVRPIQVSETYPSEVSPRSTHERVTRGGGA